ncbi:SNF2 helicase-associated domain-containing protein, partial [Bacillus altitudinis]|uniref:SNF2 helicase-associated domain-containing protein n=1 Tax=Bacillus altitudinis TaxID=293387 RepID=UPI001643D8CD
MDGVMEFNWGFGRKGIEVREDELKEVVESKRGLVNIGGEWIKMDGRFMEEMKKWMEGGEKEGVDMW